MPWSQVYSPLGGVAVSALVAALPVVTLLGLLAFFHVRAHLAALAGLLVALGIAIFVYHMPASLAGAAAIFGAGYGLFPIGWIILNAIFIYQLSVDTGGFAALQRQIAGISSDRRVQALLIAFSFGAFIEGAAGFGTPVAITGALLIGLGFRPLEAAKLALIGNTAPVAFGALGTPLLTLAKITGLDLGALSAMVGRQLPFFSLIVPFWIIVAQSGWRGMRAVWPACLVTGASFAVSQFVVSNYVGPMLVDIISAAVSIVALVALMKIWQPADRVPTDANRAAPDAAPSAPRLSSGASAARAWLPWVFLSVFVFLWGLPAIKKKLDAAFAPAVAMPHLHQLVQRMPPVVPKPALEDAIFNFNFLSATGTALLLAGVLAGFCLGLGPAKILSLYLRTVWRVRISLLTIAIMLGLGFTTRYSGTDTTMGLALATTGIFYPFFSPLIGWLGVALTGSDTSSNVLFGNLQKVTAQQLGLPPVLMAASNSSGGVMGKMIDAQSIVVASVATGGHEDSPDAGTVLRAVFWHSVALALLMGALVTLQTYCWPGVVPK
ncbi:MAG TPA: lactate permease LctP family transporter [Opitutaceae bacterium]|nr:lactate permease LctP family transporter [Opitutaceae bacterium]